MLPRYSVVPIVSSRVRRRLRAVQARRAPPPNPRGSILSPRRPAASSNLTLSRILTVDLHTLFVHPRVYSLGTIIVSADAVIESYELGRGNILNLFSERTQL